ncbi:MAG TPA: D-alanyl-D-alanine carboxypeptidase/D-alanyl-D-alanine-endopeptidase [bacterium]|nr:D-alanyl-D-alanine carboxypeptidase/D-alanyl-D-alanine-endopeptidase [bacterium]HOL93815.1 D-alanyl-D-alanine carboxypeptidase/D-alanyl-D-alanine-endopeptidase [bacterium]HPO99783.1 D-alanyl-D-alanine carboxypeptidase/D-alanyl-D-alanine-endopeptidase [bacterium]HXK92639.1 D-alanyl-D-alanine carboxypeptidase/D-alanyl-D-alanine-endopeptidase [bacterium]
MPIFVFPWSIRLILFGLASVFAMPSASASLESDLNALFTKSLPQAVWSIQVDNLEEEENLFALTPQRSLIPASNMKIVVCAAALLRLKPDFRYQTGLWVSGKQSGSTLEGDLIVVGSGDPSIGGRFNGNDVTALFRQWAGVLKQNNILRVTGDVIGVDDVFDDIRHGLNWHPDNFLDWFAAEVSALSFNDACVDIIVEGAAKAGTPATVRTNPPTQYLFLSPSVMTVATAKSEKGVAIRRSNDDLGLTIQGSIRTNRSSLHYAAVPNPTLYFVSVLREVLQAEGITVEGAAKDADDVPALPAQKTWRLLHVHESPPLSALVNVCLKNSQNLYAEHLLKTLGYHDYGTGSWEMGVLAMKDILNEHGCNLDSQFIADGSGLSRENRLSAQSLIQVLRVISNSPYKDLFQEALPRSGVDGTLKRRLNGPSTNGRIFAKTGTLNGVRSLSGYLNAKSGKTYVFSMLGNSTRGAQQMSGMMDQALELIASQG